MDRLFTWIINKIIGQELSVFCQEVRLSKLKTYDKPFFDFEIIVLGDRNDRKENI
jgi:hypothetical protein